MGAELVPVTEGDKPVLLNLVQFYCYDMSVVRGVDVTEHGLFTYRYVDHYFLEPDRDALFVRHDGALAGFVMSRELSPNEREVAEFFIMRRYRRAGVGTTAAHELFSLHKGRWVVAFDDANTDARAYWPNVVERAAVGAVDRLNVGPPEHRFDRTILRFSNS
jgi:predicted acetyltransferase